MFERIFPGTAKLDELEVACIDVERKKTANLMTVEGRNAQLPDGTPSNVNVVQFDPKDDESEVQFDLKFVRKADATPAFLAQMAAEGRAQVGGDMSIFIEDQPDTVLIFAK
jgi:hypothetical protein